MKNLLLGKIAKPNSEKLVAAVRPYWDLNLRLPMGNKSQVHALAS